MKRYFIDKIEDSVILSGDEHNHLAFVLRSKIGDKVILCPQDGFDYIAKIVEINKMQTILKVLQKEKNAMEPGVDVTLFVALLKGEKLDYVVQKITELGLNAVYPVTTKFVQCKKESVKIERLKKIATEASKQCGRALVPVISQVITFNNMTELLNGYDLVIFPYEKATETDIKTFLDSAVNDMKNTAKEIKNHEKACKKVAIIIGSEGGFSDEEADALVNLKVTPLTLGKRILRAETACVAVSTAVMFSLEQFK